jgi:hypothetical protein
MTTEWLMPVFSQRLATRFNRSQHQRRGNDGPAGEPDNSRA